MICPACGTRLKDGLTVCPECGAALAHAPSSDGPEDARSEWEATLTVVMRILVHILIWILSLSILGFGLYKLYYWRQADAMHKLYENGTVQMPELETVELADGRNGHAITFFGSDGDTIYIEELEERFTVVGGKAVVEVADAEWFTPSGNASTAEIYLTPIQTTESGEKLLLPIVSFSVEMPVSPLTIISPTEKYITTLSSAYELKLKVVYGSTVLVGGEDVTSLVDRQGNLTVNVAIYPHGENPVSILVQTPNHLEVREDLVFYRQPLEIDLDLSTGTEFTSITNSMTIRGSVDPEASLTVETPYEDGSLKVDADGEFSFRALFSRLGYNPVTIRAKKAGKQDAVISFEVYYVPAINEYSRSAWKMDYQQVLYCWDVWDGRVFLCRGDIVAVLSDEPNIVVIDVSDAGTGQYLVIENMSDLHIGEPGGRYTIYADISGQAEYGGKTVTRLIGRYAEKLD